MRLLIAVLAATCVLAQTEAPKPAANRIIGDVTARDADAKQFTVKTSTGAVYTVVFTDATLFVRVPPGERDLTKATKISASEVDTGDRIMARGDVVEDQKRIPAAKQVIVMTKSDLAQKHERDRAEWQKRGISGTVAAVDPAAKQITLTMRGRDGVKTATVITTDETGFKRYAPDSIRWADVKPSSMAEIMTGDQVRVLGNKKEDGSQLTAEDIVSGSFRTVAGTVISVDPEKGEIRLADTALKKPIVVEVAKDTLLKKLPLPVAYMLARRLNPTFQMPEGNGVPGGPGAGGRSAGGPAGGPGQGGPGAAGAPDLQQMLERMPAFTIAELKPGDALIISSTVGADRTRVNAISVLAGVEPILVAAPRTFGQASGIANWNLEMSVPMQ
jgi:hypothetical protein